MSRATAVLITLLVYNAALILIGVLYQRRTHDGVDFYLGGRQLGPLVAAVSAAASSSSAWTLLGVSGAAYAWGFSAVWLFPSCVGGFVINWYLLAPALQRASHRSGALTVTEMLAGREGSPLRQAIIMASSFIILVSLGTYVASQFQGAGKTFAETFGISLAGSILLGTAVVVFYTMLGGFWAVSVTDTLQGLIMAATSFVMPLAALAAVGGPGELYTGLSGVGVDGYQSLTRNLAPVAGFGFVLGLFGIGMNYPGQPHVVNRFMALEDRPGALRSGGRIAVAWALIVYSGMLVVGWCARLLLPLVDDPEVAFIGITTQLFPPVIAGVMLAAVLSAIMSTADSQLLVASSTVTHDLGIGRSSGWSLIARSRFVVVLLSAGAAVAALVGNQEIFSQVLFAFGAMGSAFGPPLLVTVLKGPVRPGYRLAAIITGFTLSVAVYYLFPAVLWKGSMERVLPLVLSLAISVAGLQRDPVPAPSTGPPAAASGG